MGTIGSSFVRILLRAIGSELCFKTFAIVGRHLSGRGVRMCGAMNFRMNLVGVLTVFVALTVSFQAPAATVTWVPDADGAWITATNWSSTLALPGVADDVTINVAGDRLITLTGGSTQTIKSLLSSERFALNNATLVIGTSAQFNNTLTIT